MILTGGASHDHGERIEEGDVHRVALTVLSTGRWFKFYGAPFYRASSRGTVLRWCVRGQLPIGWKSVHLAHRHYIYYAGAGDVRPARKRGVRQVRRLAPGSDLEALRLTPLPVELVEAVFDTLFPVKEWVEFIAVKSYGIRSVEYAHQMCACIPNERAGHTPARLPGGWRSVRVGDSWLIYHHSLVTRRELIEERVVEV